MHGPVLVVITSAFYSSGGISAVNRLMINSLAEREQINILSLNEKEPLMDEKSLNNFHLSTKYFNKNKKRYVRDIWSEVLTKKYSLVICDHVNLAFALAPLRYLGIINYTVWAFGVEIFFPKPTFEGKVGLLSAEKCVACSNYTKNHINIRFPKVRVFTCELALDRDWPFQNLDVLQTNVKPLLLLQPLAGGPKYLGNQVVLHVGRMDPAEKYKGQDSLLYAFPEVYAQYPDAELVLVGEGADLDRIRSIALSLPVQLQRSIYLPGFVSTNLLEQLYRHSYLFAMPSLDEGFGIVYLEAMSRAKPCLGARSAATPYVIQEGKTGLLVESTRSPKQVAEKINWFLGHPAEAEAMGRAGYLSVKSNYLFEHFTKRFWEIVDS